LGATTCEACPGGGSLGRGSGVVRTASETVASAGGGAGGSFSADLPGTADESPGTSELSIGAPLYRRAVWGATSAPSLHVRALDDVGRCATRAAVETISYLLGLLRDPGPIIEWGGYPALALIIFLETGALVAFLPGDSLLVVAGLYARDGALSLLLLNAILIPCAVLGDATSYVIGQKTGPLIFRKVDPPDRTQMSFVAYWLRWAGWKLRNPESLLQAKSFYDKHGGKAIIIARFMPIVRTFVPVVAGVAQMPYRRFASYNVIGGVSWVASMTLAGYFLGGFDIVRHHLEKVIIAVVVISIVPGVIGWWRGRNEAKAEAKKAAETGA